MILEEILHSEICQVGYIYIRYFFERIYEGTFDGFVLFKKNKFPGISDSFLKNWSFFLLFYLLVYGCFHGEIQLNLGYSL